MNAYDAALADQIRPLPVNPEFHDLVRYATLAANGHNSEPWKFRKQHDGVEILPDFSHRTPAVDPDDHHLFASLGCAAENLSIAAKAHRMTGEVNFDPTETGHGHVDLGTSSARESDLLAAIPTRQCSRSTYDGKAASPDIAGRLARAANNCGVDALFLTEQRKIEDILSLVIDGNSRQLRDPAFVTELKSWIRFNPRAAAKTRDGLYSGSSGNPNLPSWIGSLMFRLLLNARSENDKYARQVRSSAGIVIFVASTDDPQGWFNAGRAYQRFALQATLDGVKNAFINQAIEVPDVRHELQDHLDIGDRRPNLVVRFGFGPSMPRSLRRPPQIVIG